MANEKNVRISIKTVFDNGVGKFIGHLDRGIKRAHAFGAAMRKGFHSAPVRLLRNALAALIGTLVAGTLQAAKFNIEMARVWTMSSKGEGWFRTMRKEIIDMSAELGIATDQLSGGLYQALSAGVPEDNVLDFLTTAAKVAVADGSDVSTAVDGISTVLNAFKMEATEAESVADQLFNTVANGKTTFAELASTMATVAPIAAANGVSLNEVLAAVASLTKQGTPTAQAMTQIRAAINGTNKALGEGWSKSMSLQEAFGKVEEKAGSSQNKLLKLVGSIEAVQAILGLTGNNAKMAAQDLESAGQAAGSANRAFQKVDQWRHWPKLWQSINGLIKTAGIELDQRLAPAIQRMIEDLASIRENDDLWAGLAESLDEAQQKLANIFAYIHGEGASGAQEVVDALGRILLGYAKNGAQDAIALLAKWMPLLGRTLGDSAKKAITEHFEINAIAKQLASDELGPVPKGREAQKEYGDRYSALVEEKRRKIIEIKAQEEGERISKVVGGNTEKGSGWGDTDIAKGKGMLDSVSYDGFKKREIQRFTNELLANTTRQSASVQGYPGGGPTEADMDRMRNGAYEAQVARELRIGSEPQAREDLYGAFRFNEKQIAQGEKDVWNSGMSGSAEDLQAAKSRLERDKGEQEEFKRLAQELKLVAGSGNTSTLQAIQALIEIQKEQARQMEQVKAQIRNGRI